MAYGDYNGPDKADKGKENGSCNRGRCQCSPARWYNHGSHAWYCDDCKNQIYDAVGHRLWADAFPDAGHPMFETRLQMDGRKAAEAFRRANPRREPSQIEIDDDLNCGGFV